MAIATTVSAVNCVPACDRLRELSESQFMLLLVDKLSTEAGIDIADITAENLNEAVTDGLCELQDRSRFYNASPEQMRAIALYLAQQLA